MKRARLGRSPSVLAFSILALCVGVALPTGAQGATAIGLGTADSYAVLGGSGVTNTGPTVLNGDLGTWPTPSITGFGGAPNGTVNGSTHQADAAAAQAQADLTTAYDNAAGQGPANTLATELGGQSLTPGVYKSQSGTFGITGALTLNAQGNPNAVFIFKTASTLISASASQVNLINGAQPCNVFWKVGSSATLGTSSAFAGNILALQSISVNNGVSVKGRLLARNGAVTLINDTVTRATCSRRRRRWRRRRRRWRRWLVAAAATTAAVAATAVVATTAAVAATAAAATTAAAPPCRSMGSRAAVVAEAVAAAPPVSITRSK